MPIIRPAETADVDAAVVTLRAAFADYPFTRHTLAAEGYSDRLAESQRLFLTRVGLRHGRVWVSEDVAAVAAWTTPDSTGLDEAFAELEPRMRELAGDRAALSEAAEDALNPHRPREPAWFLGTVGVLPDRQGRGLGRAVVEPGLRAADEQGAPAYLETSLPGNVAFYRGLGFEVVAEVELPGGGPTTWAMSRPPVTR
ncbi:GNAT family N-acetyltransferase [Saccharopolyspora sp. CA-218241]|uniref:GNAT family N-acetyltransferase n=1 Tax=Saccharopolyspora sp. CA-218241 TaxID=3240027 RepID=UPI003D9791F4